MNAIVVSPQNGVEHYRQSTDAADVCKDIVVSTAMEIQNRKYVKVEGWQAIAIAHGCTGSARDVQAVQGGVRAIGEVRRMSDGAVIAEAEGFVGEDEPTWYGGEITSRYGKKLLPKRPDYAIRAMAQTRAISRACRSAFAHVVVMMDVGLSTTPAEEVPAGGFDDTPSNQSKASDVFPGDTSGKPTLSDRSTAFLKDCEGCASIKDLSSLADSKRAVDLKRDLDRSDSDLGATVEARVGELFDALTAKARA